MFFESFRRPNPTASLDPRVRFWSVEYLWPEDTLTHISLAVAVQVVGRRLFEENWTGKEPAVELQKPLDERLSTSVSPQDLQRGCQILFEHHPGYRERALLPFNWPMPNDEEWTVAVEVAKKAAEDSKQAYGRFLRVCDALQKAFKFNTIATAIRPHDGGAEEPVSREFWNSEHCLCRFDCCQVDPAHPFSARAVTDDGWWIYVERSSFELALQGQRQADIGSAAEIVVADDRISPFLKCMITAAINLDLNPDNQIDKEALKLIVSDFWKGSESLSDRDRDRMATLLRLPECKLGRGRPKRQKPGEGVSQSP